MRIRPRALFLAVLLFLAPISIIAQEAVLQGKVTDASTGEALPGVNILAVTGSGTVSSSDGTFSIDLATGQQKVSFSFVGYQTFDLLLMAEPGQKIIRDVTLQPRPFELNTAVVSASRYEQRLADVTVSMEVLKAQAIKDLNPIQLDEAIRLLPGVDVIDGQANIRGGSGYSYGAGSRVMVLVDGLPVLTGDVNEVKWTFLPVENIGQVEVIKGASSALYGSSALNGVINIRTAKPGLEPSTNLDVFTGFYARPARKELSWWWENDPFFGGFRFSHLRKAGAFDVNLGATEYIDEGYRQDNYLRYIKLNGGFRYSPAKLESLSTGLQLYFQYQQSSDFLLWTDADSGAFIPNPATISPTEGLRIQADPYVSYYDRGNGGHHLKMRYYKATNTFQENSDKNNGSDLLYSEYQYDKTFSFGLHWTAGLAASYTIGNAELYGDHTGSSLAFFTQFDKKFFERLSASFGFRWEGNRMDEKGDDSRPVIRAGLNYQAARYTFLRASFGQGYRYPSMAERYTATDLGGLNIFPNPDLDPETGWSVEAGLRQGFRIKEWQGFIDLAGFQMRYHDMMEFTFGIYKPDSVEIPTLDHLGFMSVNIGDTRITGIDISVNGQGNIGRARITFLAGYTYIDPVEMATDSTEEIVMKYRYRHSAKGDLQASVGRLSAGVTLIFTSFMERIDAAFEEMILGQEFFPGLKQYRQENNDGVLVVDARVAYQISRASQVGLYVKNLLNEEYMGRPGDILPPANITIQYRLTL